MIPRGRARVPGDLESRVARRKEELIAEGIEHRKNSSRAGAAEAIDRISGRLLELARLMKDGVGDGWDNVGKGTERMLDDWIAR